MNRWVRVLVLALAAIGCNRQPASAPIAGPQSGEGWEVRYLATLSLARRGSEKFHDPVVTDLMLEMLDFDQQLRNSRRTIDGREVVDQSNASATVYGALDALAEYHRRRPDDDLSAFKTAIDKLVDGRNATLANKAKAVREQLAIKPAK
ncbi:MAG: hypothetical protein ACJ8C4_14975 [Gemmataceae bacterium]